MPARILILPPGTAGRPGVDAHGSVPEALVCPVNARLEGMTPWAREVGVAGGPSLAERLEAMPEAREGLPAGAVLLTPAGALPVSFLLHAVLLSPEEGVSRGVVARVLSNVLRRVEEWGIATLALPLLGAGPGQLEEEVAAEVLADALADGIDGAWALVGGLGVGEGDADPDTDPGKPPASSTPSALRELRILATTPAQGRLLLDTLRRGIPGASVSLDPALEGEDP